MARISGIDLPRDKRIEIALTYIFGIGLPTAQKILARSGIDPNTRVKNLTEDDEKKLREAIDGQIKVEGDLRREVAGHIKRLTDIGCYRGLRHRRACPFAVSARRPTPARARVRRRPSARRRRPPRSSVRRARAARQPTCEERAGVDAPALFASRAIR